MYWRRPRQLYPDSTASLTREEVVGSLPAVKLAIPLSEPVTITF